MYPNSLSIISSTLNFKIRPLETKIVHVELFFDAGYSVHNQLHKNVDEKFNNISIK